MICIYREIKYIYTEMCRFIYMIYMYICILLSQHLVRYFRCIFLFHLYNRDGSMNFADYVAGEVQ